MYRADHVGSLLRPWAVLDARTDSHVTADRLRAIEDEHILRALARQKDLGFEIFTDGEFRRRGFMSDFYESVEGLDHDGSIARAWTSAGATGSVALTRARKAGGAEKRKSALDIIARMARCRRSCVAQRGQALT